MNNDPKWMTPKQLEMQASAQLPCIKSDARRLTPKQKLTELESQLKCCQEALNNSTKARGVDYANYVFQRGGLESQLKRYHEALERLSTWPPCYPANANIERMRQFAERALKEGL